MVKRKWSIRNKGALQKFFNVLKKETNTQFSNLSLHKVRNQPYSTYLFELMDIYRMFC